MNPDEHANSQHDGRGDGKELKRGEDMLDNMGEQASPSWHMDTVAEPQAGLASKLETDAVGFLCLFPGLQTTPLLAAG